MLVLAIDTTSNTAAAAVVKDGIVLGERILNFKKTHSQKIMPMISELLDLLRQTVPVHLQVLESEWQQ